MPVRPGIVGHINAAARIAFRSAASPALSSRCNPCAQIVHYRPQPVRIARRNRDPDFPDKFVMRQPGGQLFPGISAVSRFPQSPARQIRRSINRPWRPPRSPQRCVQNSRIFRVHRDIDRADIIRRVFIPQDFFPGRASVCCPVQAALGIRIINMTQCRHVYPIGIRRIDHHTPDVFRRVKTDVGPRFSPVGRLEHPDSIGMLAANIRLARTDINDVGVRRRHCDRANRADGNAFIGNRHPGAPRIFGLENASAHRPHVKSVRLARVPRNAERSPSTHRPDVAPSQSGKQRRGILRLLRQDLERDESRQA